MKILALSDLHGYLPKIPPCDILLLAGDYEPGAAKGKDRAWILGPFKDWLGGLPAQHIIGVAGNHDWTAQSDPEAYRGLPWHYLQDEGIRVAGLTFWGSPWTRRFYDWAFMAEEEKLRSIFTPIPQHVDVLITHGPPAGIRDRNHHGESCGSNALATKVSRVAPRLHVFGHIHESYGTKTLDLGNPRGVSVFSNVSYVNGQYIPTNEYIEFDDLF